MAGGLCASASLAQQRPHSPYDPPQRFVDMYEGRDIPAPVVGSWCDALPLDEHPERNPTAARGNFGSDYAQQSRRYYYPKSVIRLLCANKLSFCHLPFRFSVAMEPHCALKT